MSSFIFLVANFGISSAYADSIYVYLPDLAGSYELGSYPKQAGGDATLKETSVNISWARPVAPQYLTLEVAGVLGEPKPKNPIDYVNDSHPGRINYNGSLIVSSSIGGAWGVDLNVNWSQSGDFQIFETYDNKTGRFYSSVSIAIGLLYGHPYFPFWSGTLDNLELSAANAFYNYTSYFDSPVTFSNKGFVFVESARAGLTTEQLPLALSNLLQLQQYQQPSRELSEPGTSLLMSLSMFGLVASWRKKRRRNNRFARNCG